MLPIFNRLKTKDSPAISVHDFQSLFEQHYQCVVRHIFFLTQDKTTAEDIAQETFIKLYHSCPISLSNPGAWLKKVASNITYNHIKGERCRRDKENREEMFQALTGESSEEIVLRKEESGMVRTALNKLPVKERMCLLLRHSGFSYEEIADVLHMPKSSVGKTIARAQVKFKEAYLMERGVVYGELL